MQKASEPVYNVKASSLCVLLESQPQNLRLVPFYGVKPEPPQLNKHFSKPPRSPVSLQSFKGLTQANWSLQLSQPLSPHNLYDKAVDSVSSLPRVARDLWVSETKTVFMTIRNHFSFLRSP
jgi:hypothetical protein